MGDVEPMRIARTYDDLGVVLFLDDNDEQDPCIKGHARTSFGYLTMSYNYEDAEGRDREFSDDDLTRRMAEAVQQNAETLSEEFDDD